MRNTLKLALLIFALFLAPAARANNPIAPNSCGAAATNVGTTATVLNCVLNNVVSGRTVLIAATTQSTTDAVTASGSETVTCPTLAVGLFAAGVLRTRLCYIVLGSSHATLTITVTATGGTDQVKALIAQEFQGLGSVDSSSATGANAASVSVTTAGANEIVFYSCRGFSNDIAPGSGFSQLGFVNPETTANQDDRTQTGYEIVSSATTITAACTVTGGTSSTVIAGLAFSISGAPSPPAIGLIQWCEANAYAVSNGAVMCPLHNTANGSKIIVAAVNVSNSTPITPNAACTETCTCPANSATLSTNVYSALFTALSLCYADTTSTHATFNVTSNGTGGVIQLWVQEVSGLTSGIDSGSEANAVAATVNYTTAAANEQTFCYAADNNANPMSPASSFTANGQQEGLFAPTQQALFMSKKTVSSGSNTCSYSITSGTQPLIATFSFNALVTSPPGYPMVF